LDESIDTQEKDERKDGQEEEITVNKLFRLAAARDKMLNRRSLSPRSGMFLKHFGRRVDATLDNALRVAGRYGNVTPGNASGGAGQNRTHKSVGRGQQVEALDNTLGGAGENGNATPDNASGGAGENGAWKGVGESQQVDATLDNA